MALSQYRHPAPGRFVKAVSRAHHATITDGGSRWNLDVSGPIAFEEVGKVTKTGGPEEAVHIFHRYFVFPKEFWEDPAFASAARPGTTGSSTARLLNLPVVDLTGVTVIHQNRLLTGGWRAMRRESKRNIELAGVAHVHSLLMRTTTSRRSLKRLEPPYHVPLSPSTLVIFSLHYFLEADRPLPKEDRAKGDRLHRDNHKQNA
jgi:hypothetical protein